MTLLFVGTLHGGLTPTDELVQVLRDLNPDEVFVEIRSEDISTENLDSYPQEMQSALAWARNQDLPVTGFDAIDEHFGSLSISTEEEQEWFDESVQELDGRSWKQANDWTFIQQMSSPGEHELMDVDSFRARQQQMAKNIRSAYQGNRTAVVTGCGHLQFFKQEFPHADFPLAEAAQ